ncbi:MAG TPA: biotin--[acetyl-CoA-carboxylase] ligase [Phycisphaerae bacterium]|nr:biotin--[acetyl-CoA-carboxylase] ligase [Phycisphaerae bacterium]
MSTPSHISEPTITRVLLALWNRPETTIQQLLRDTLAPLPDLQESLHQLRQRGCLIEQTPTTISLTSTPISCWRDILEDFSRSKNLRLARRVLIYSKTTSTNDIAWQSASAPQREDSDGLLILADEQSAGRGRLGHTWLAKPGQSILLSLLLKNPAADTEPNDQLTLLAGLATARAIESLLPHNTRLQIKWPNDILHAGKKIAGILVERRSNLAVIGIGINAAQSVADFPPDLAPRATSLYQLTSFRTDRLRAITTLLEQLNTYLTAPPPLDTWLADWKSRCPLLNQHITLRANDQLITGQILDIDPLRGLLFRDDTGATRFLSAQTTTLAT